MDASPDVERQVFRDAKAHRRDSMLSRFCSIRLALILMIIVFGSIMCMINIVWASVYGTTLTKQTQDLLYRINQQIYQRTYEKLIPPKLLAQSLLNGYAALGTDTDPSFAATKDYIINAFKTFVNGTDDVYSFNLGNVRNSTFYSTMGVSNKDGYVDNYFTWPGFTAVNQLQHYPLDSDFKWNPPAAYVGRSTFQTGIWSKLRVNPTPNSGNGVLAVAKCKQVNGLRDCPIFITYCLGVQNATTKSINYVASVAFIASALSDDLQEFVTSLPNSAMMIIEKNTGNILGSSDPNHIITANNGSELVPAQNYNNSMLASAAAYLRSNYGNDYAGITKDGVNQQQFRFYDAKSNKYVFGTFKLVFDPSGIQWINVVVVPEVSLIGDYLVTLIVVVVVLVVVLIMFLVLGGFFAAWITRPLTSLAREMKLVQNMNLDRIKQQQSHFGELITIQSAFMSMVDRLKSYKAFLPGHILQRDYGYDETELDQTPEPSKQQVEVIDSDPKMFDLGVNKKNITMMVITITNSESTIEQHGEDLSDYQAYHGALLTMVSEAVNKNKGHIDSFDQSHFVACWGTGAAARNGSEQDAVNALTACETILNRIKMFKDDSTVSAVTNPIRISVCSGVAFVGNMGNYNKRLLCLFGPVCVVSDAVCDASEKLGLSVVVDDATCNLVGNQFSTHQVGTVVIDQRVVVIRQLVLGEKSNVYNDFVYQRSKLIKSE